MKDIDGKVAVVTGAASGIGRALAYRLTESGMRVVLADIEQHALEKTASELRALDRDILPVPTDVSNASSMEKLAKKTLDTYGAVHVVCNNAGVCPTGAVWENTIAEWEWVIGVNLWGVIHGIRVFVPIMLDQDTEGHINSTASIGGLVTAAWVGSYQVTKHGVVALSESLALALKEIESKIRVSVLCPLIVNTQIMRSKRNVPKEMEGKSLESNYEAGRKFDEWLRNTVDNEGTSPSETANLVLKAIQNDQFYIFTAPGSEDLVRHRMDSIIKNRYPTANPGANVVK